jgi:hypothetical protein
MTRIGRMSADTKKLRLEYLLKRALKGRNMKAQAIGLGAKTKSKQSPERAEYRRIDEAVD